jgi:mono/diheme cytochrome c family protein
MQTIPNALTLITLLVFASACGAETPTREWTPEDHGYPVRNDLPTTQQAPPAEDDEEPSVRAARALWTVSCAGCHGRGGRGDGSSKPPGAQVADLTRSEWQSSRTDAQIAQVIRDGKGMMPAFGDKIVAAGIDALVAHVRSFAAPAEPPTAPAVAPAPAPTAPAATPAGEQAAAVDGEP